jgi:HPt (histidine-containing phosphotransfer) domain-containing protein
MSKANPTPLLDHEIISQLIFLAEDDPKFIPELLTVLKTELNLFQQQALALIDRGEHAPLERLIHKLSGASANLGAHALQLQLRNLQASFSALEPVQLKIELEQIRLLADQSLVELERLFKISQ